LSDFGFAIGFLSAFVICYGGDFLIFLFDCATTFPKPQISNKKSLTMQFS